MEDKKTSSVYNRMSRYADICFLGIFALLLFIRYMSTTMVSYKLPYSAECYATVLAGLIGITRITLSAVSERKFSPPALISMTAVFFCLSMAYSKSYDIQMLESAILIVSMYRMDYRKILKVYLLVAVPITVLTIIGSQVGLVENLVYQKSGARTRISFGFIYPTDFAAHIFYLSIAWLILRLERITYFEIISFFVLSGCLYLFCDALCGALCELLLAVAVLFVKLYIKLRVPIKPDKFVHMIFFIGCMILPILLAIVIILLSYYFTWSSDFLKKANFFLSGRPRMGNLAFSNYDITMFGDVINMNGYGGTTTHTFTRKDYFFLDSSYMWMLFRYGICGLLCSVGMTEAIMIKCRKNLFIIVSIALICVHSFIEHHFSGYEYNVLFLMAFASFESIAGYGKEKNRIENDLF